jgi:hypothetical protein
VAGVATALTTGVLIAVPTAVANVVPNAVPDARAAITPGQSLALVVHVGVPADVNADDLTDTGDAIAYTYTVTNTGTGPAQDVAVADPGVGPVGCPQALLPVDASEVCTADQMYAVSSYDVIAGAVVDTATATGISDGHAVVSAASSVRTPTSEARPLLRLVTSAAPASVADAGALVTSDYLVTNAGNVTISAIAVSGSFAPGPSAPIRCPRDTLAPGAVMTCSATLRVTRADLQAGWLTELGIVSGSNPQGNPVASNTSVSAVAAFGSAALVASMTAGPVPPDGFAAGGSMIFTVTLTNAGDAALTRPRVVDSVISGVDLPATLICPTTRTLLPDGHEVCTLVQRITPADIEAGLIVDVATALADGPGDTLTSTATWAGKPETANPAIGSAPTVEAAVTSR